MPAGLLERKSQRNVTISAGKGGGALGWESQREKIIKKGEQGFTPETCVGGRASFCTRMRLDFWPTHHTNLSIRLHKIPPILLLTTLLRNLADAFVL